MGITIHWETMFKGTKTELKKKLNELADFARVIGFKEAGPIYEMDYATDFNTPDKHTPVVKNEDGKLEIDGSYRWAKIQADPRAPFIDTKASIFEQAKQREQWRKNKDQMHRKNGLVLSLWWGEGCEATNLCFIRTGKGKLWTGSSFTKTQYASDFTKAHVTVCTLLKAAVGMGLAHNVSDEADYYETEDITVLTDANESMLKMLAAMTGMLTEQFGAENVSGGGLMAEEKLKEFPQM